MGACGYSASRVKRPLQSVPFLDRAQLPEKHPCLGNGIKPCGGSKQGAVAHGFVLCRRASIGITSYCPSRHNLYAREIALSTIL